MFETKRHRFSAITIRLLLCSLLAGTVCLLSSVALWGQTLSVVPQISGGQSARGGFPAMTLILVRHAEKNEPRNPDDKDPDLSSAGLARAQEIAKMFGDSGISAIFATQYRRTQHTVRPLAQRLGIPVWQVEAKKTAALVTQLRSRQPGQVIFVAGHNNTVPEIIAALGGPQMPIIPEDQFDNLYILVVQSDGAARLVKMKY